MAGAALRIVLRLHLVSQQSALTLRASPQLASERVRAMLLASDPARRRLLADGGRALSGLSTLPRRAILAAARGA